jgi:hypothetical protein
MTADAAAQTGAGDRPVVLFVLGMARSGTSALTRILSLCGAALPAGMTGGLPGNPSGYWEPRKVTHLNEVILRRHGSTLHDPTLRLQAEGAFSAEEKAACVAEIRAYLSTLPAAALVVIKDLQITALPALWFDAARLAGFDIAVVIAVRHPQEVIASLVRLPAELSGALWLKYSLLAERHTRALPRVFVEYANLLDDWHREVKRISAALAIDLNTRDEGAVEEFLTPDLRHYRYCGPVPEPFGTDWMSTVYHALQVAARDEPWYQSALDRVLENYHASEHGFRAAFEGFHRIYQGSRLVPPSINRLASEVIAMAHRRKGAWA